MTEDQQVTNKLILEEIKKSRQELKATIEATEVKVLLKIEEINRRLNKVEQQNIEIEEKLEQLDRLGRKNNIIIFGLQQPQQITAQSICQEIKRLIDVNISLSDLNNFYPLGKEEYCPLKVEFISYIKKASILKNSNKLKGTNIYIANDLTQKQRNENKILRKHLYLAKQEGKSSCYIKRNKLHVDNEIYTPQELENCEEAETTHLEKPNSAPETPTVQTLSNREERKNQEKSLDKFILKTPENRKTNPGESSKGNKEFKESDRPAKANKIKTRSGSVSLK